MTIQAKMDTSAWTSVLDKLSGPLKVSLARSMAVAGGKVLRDEAKMRAPVGTPEGGSITPGLLRSSIYLAYREGVSNKSVVVYSVTWNSKTAPHGHLAEFGHWQTHAAYKGADGEWHRGAKLAQPKWVAAHPFLRPTIDAAGGRAKAAMIERGRERLPELLRDTYTPADEEFV